MKTFSKTALQFLVPAAIMLLSPALMAGQSFADSATASATGGTAAVSVAGGGASAGGGIVGGNSTVSSTGPYAGGSAGTDGEVYGTANTKGKKAWVTVGGSGNTWAEAYSKPYKSPDKILVDDSVGHAASSSVEASCGNMRSVGHNTQSLRKRYKYCVIAVDRGDNSLYAGCCSSKYYASKKKR